MRETASRPEDEKVRFYVRGIFDLKLTLKQDIHPKVAQERLGQSIISTTLYIYNHVALSLPQAAANKFDDMLKVGYNDKVTVTN